jgi:hypothetical protein
MRTRIRKSSEKYLPALGISPTAAEMVLKRRLWMRIERTIGISRALPLTVFSPAEEQARRSSRNDDPPAERVLEEIAAQFDMRDMDAAEAFQLADRLMQEQLISSTAYLCLTGVPMRHVLGVGCMPMRGPRPRNDRFDYIAEFEGYVEFSRQQDNVIHTELLLSVLNVLCSLDRTRRNGSLNIQV